MSTMPVARTWTDGEIPDATIMNAYVRDGFLATLGKLDSTQFTSSQAFINFAAIPQTYRHLLVVGGYASDTSAAVVNGLIEFNNDVSTVYFSHNIASTGSAVAGADFLGVAPGYTIDAAGNADPKMESAGMVLISNYTSTVYKSALSLFFNMGSTAAGDLAVGVRGTFWKSTAAITSVLFAPATGGFSHGGLTLYGIP